MSGGPIKVTMEVRKSRYLIWFDLERLVCFVVIQKFVLDEALGRKERKQKVWVKLYQMSFALEALIKNLKLILVSKLKRRDSYLFQKQ